MLAAIGSSITILDVHPLASFRVCNLHSSIPFHCSCDEVSLALYILVLAISPRRNALEILLPPQPLIQGEPKQRESSAS